MKNQRNVFRYLKKKLNRQSYANQINQQCLFQEILLGIPKLEKWLASFASTL